MTCGRPPVHTVGLERSRDDVVQDTVVSELKAVDRLLPIHEAQLLRLVSWCRMA